MASAKPYLSLDWIFHNSLHISLYLFLDIELELNYSNAWSQGAVTTCLIIERYSIPTLILIYESLYLVSLKVPNILEIINKME